MNTTDKRCIKCGVEKPRTPEYFHKDKNRDDGFYPWCKACKKQGYEKHRSLKTINHVQELLLAKRLLERGYKLCPKCGEIKPATAEYYHLEKRTGRMPASWCRKCEAVKNIRNAPIWTQKAKANGTYNYATRNASYSRYKKRNPEKGRFLRHKYQSRKLSLPSSFTDKDWYIALNYFHGCCAVCGCQLNDLFGERPAQADHWIPLCNPNCPGTIPTNILPLCGQIGGCNQLKGTKNPVEWLNSRFGTRKAKIILKRIEDYFDSLSDII